MTQGVIKHIIPAIASTNAIIAGSCANEAFKMATNCATTMNNYMMYVGDQGIYTYTFELQKKEDCPVCGHCVIKFTIQPEKTLADLIEMLLEFQTIQLKKPSLRTASKSLYMQAPKVLELATRSNLEKRIDVLISSDEEITVTDDSLPIIIRLMVSFGEE